MSRRNKTTGIIGTLLFHILIIISFLFLGLKYQDPPPAEKGISINFGIKEKGEGKIEPKNNHEITEIIEKKTTAKSIKNTKNKITQEQEKTVSINKTKVNQKKQKKEEIIDEIIEEIKPKINKKALFKNKKQNKTNSEGLFNNKENQGLLEGNVNTENHKGSGISQKGTSYQLSGRTVEHKEKPIYTIQEEGTVVVMITVDRIGNVITAIAGAKGSTTLNKQLLQKAKNAALKTKFNTNKSAPNTQQGKIIYHFSLN